MKNKRDVAIMWVLALLPMVLVGISWGVLPERVPIHWSLDGAVSYGSKRALWLLALLSPAVAALYQFLPRIDPRRGNYERFQMWYDGFGLVLPLIFLVMMGVTLVEAFRPGTLPVGRLVLGLMAALFLFVGNMMGKVKQNFFMGFRTPWALSDPDVWNRTQRMGGKVFFLTGAVSIPMAFLAPEKLMFWAFLLLLLGGVALTYFMSWRWYREKRHGDQEP